MKISNLRPGRPGSASGRNGMWNKAAMGCRSSRGLAVRAAVLTGAARYRKWYRFDRRSRYTCWRCWCWGGPKFHKSFCISDLNKLTSNEAFFFWLKSIFDRILPPSRTRVVVKRDLKINISPIRLILNHKVWKTVSKIKDVFPTHLTSSLVFNYYCKS